MKENDMDLKLLRGLPIEIEGFGRLHPLKLDEIALIGESQYNQYLGLLLSEKKDIKVDGIDDNYDSFDIMLVQFMHDTNFRNFINSIFGESLQIDERGFFYLGDIQEQRVLHKGNVNSVKSVLKKQNFIKDTDEKEEYKPANDATKELIEKIKAYKEKIKQQNKDDGLNLSDIISIVGTYSPDLNLFNIWDLTVYQLYTAYMRLMLKDNYDTQIYLLPHTSSDKSPELKHWATKLNIK